MSEDPTRMPELYPLHNSAGVAGPNVTVVGRPVTDLAVETIDTQQRLKAELGIMAQLEAILPRVNAATAKMEPMIDAVVKAGFRLAAAVNGLSSLFEIFKPKKTEV